jgi:hypothetical protein
MNASYRRTNHLKICEIPSSRGKYNPSRGEYKTTFGSAAGTYMGH